MSIGIAIHMNVWYYVNATLVATYPLHSMLNNLDYSHIPFLGPSRDGSSLFKGKNQINHCQK